MVLFLAFIIFQLTPWYWDFFQPELNPKYTSRNEVLSFDEVSEIYWRSWEAKNNFYDYCVHRIQEIAPHPLWDSLKLKQFQLDSLTVLLLRAESMSVTECSSIVESINSLLDTSFLHP